MPLWLVMVGAAFGAIALVLPIVLASRHKASIGWLSATLATWVILAGLFGFLYWRQVTSAESQAEASAPPPEPTVAAATPAEPGEESDLSSVRLTADADGRFYVTGLVNGGSVRFQVDPDSELVVLTGDDAKHAGLDPSTLDFGGQRNAQGGSADVVIYQLAVGPIRLVNVKGRVDLGGRGVSILGKSFLDRIGGYQVDGNALVLQK